MAAGANGIGVSTSQHASISLVGSAFAQGITTSDEVTKNYQECLKLVIEKAQKVDQAPDKSSQLADKATMLAKEICGSNNVSVQSATRQNSFFAPWGLRF